MIYYKGSDVVPEKGFIYVASLNVMYYELAIHSATTLKDFHPDAHVTLFTHEKFVDKKCEVFDNVIVNIPVQYRTKMWAMARTPYVKTLYNDADSFIMHRDIRSIHNFLDDCDMFFTPVTPYTTASPKWAYMDKNCTEVPKYHGAVCGYNKTNLTIDFMQTWYEEYIKQRADPGWPYEQNHYKEWKIFDMFTLWRMTNKKEKEFERFNELNINVLPLRYNCTASHAAEDKKRPVIHQIDSQTVKKIPNFWKIIEEKRNNEIYKFKERPINQIPPEYN